MRKQGFIGIDFLKPDPPNHITQHKTSYKCRKNALAEVEEEEEKIRHYEENGKKRERKREEKDKEKDK